MKTALSAEEYLRTSFPDLDREYRDGELVERSLPDSLHGRTQGLLAFFFADLRKKLSLYAAIGTRMKLRERLYLISDVAVWQSPQPLLPMTPPLVAIEILSPDDRASGLLDKLREYKKWGVPHVWLVDPYSWRMYNCETGLAETPSLKIPELGIELRPTDIFE